MLRSIIKYSEEFASSSRETPQFRAFYFAFKADMKRILKEHAKRFKFHKGHFDIYGFFELNNGRIYYFSTGDVRWLKGTMLLRTAEHFADWTGGTNGNVAFNEDFADNLLKSLKIKQNPPLFL